MLNKHWLHPSALPVKENPKNGQKKINMLEIIALFKVQ